MAHRFEHGAFGDLVEDDTLDGHALGRVALLKGLEHVPRDGFAFAVGVGGEVEVLRAARRARDGAEVLVGLGVDLVRHREVVVGTHRALHAGADRARGRSSAGR